MLPNAAWSLSRSTVADDAASLIAPDCWRSIAAVDSIRFEVVVFSAVIGSGGSLWWAIAWARMTAVRRAERVVVVARWTPLISSRLLRRITSSARYPWT